METVKVARTGLAALTLDDAQGKIEIYCGKGEVALLLAIRCGIFPDMATIASARGYFALWRKSDKEIEGLGNTSTYWQSKDDLIYWDIIGWYREDAANAHGSSGIVQFKSFYLPKPLVLIRAPRFTLYSNCPSTVSGYMDLYYTNVKVSKDELAKLMVKDHE